MSGLPVSVIIVTKNEESQITQCLRMLEGFGEIIVVDSHSADRTAEFVRAHGAQVISFEWDGQYPKKRQWCLDYLELKYDWVFWVDADELVSPELVQEIRDVFTQEPEYAGYFIKSRYVWDGAVLQYGLMNQKIALFHKNRMVFPIVDDLPCEGMGEIEGHYQPVLIDGGAIGVLNAGMMHYAYEDTQSWLRRHERYARWEVCMSRRSAWPEDPVWWRQRLKVMTRRSRFRPWLMFVYSYVLKFGFLDGRRGFDFALSRKRYCDMVLAARYELS